MKLVWCLLGAVVVASRAAWAFEPPLFSLNEAQIKGFAAYAKEKGEKAFAAGPDGQFSAQTGYASATVAAGQALKACDADIDDAAKRCLIIDLNGMPVPPALQLAQASRAEPEALGRPVPLRDFTLDAEAWAALQGFAEKPEHKAFAISLKGSWARSWEAASLEEAEKQALEACNKKERAAAAPCFIIARNGERVDARLLSADPERITVQQP